MMRIIRITFWVALCMVAASVPIAQAQQQAQQPDNQPQQGDQSGKPIPAYRSPLAGAAGNEDADPNADPARLIPDNRSLAGAQVLSLGGPTETHNYWQPHVDFTSTVDSNGLSTTGNTGWTTWSSFYGGVDLHRNSGNSSLTLLYTGGASISNNGSADNGIVQNLQFGEKLIYHRTTLTLLDQLSYLPETAFGYQAPGLGNVPGSGSIGLQPGLAPGQGILTARGQRVSNTLNPQVDISLTGRSTLTFVGTYSLLHYFDNNLLNYYNAGFQAGYNYQMTRKDTLALLYHFTAYRYSNFNQSIDDHVAQVSYGRRVTGKLAFQIAAGPEFTSFATPITNTSGTGAGSPSNSTSHVYWSLNSSMTYQFRRTGLGLTYNHGVSGGSGVQAGSIADTVTGNVTQPLSRTFTAIWSPGYSRNSGLTVAIPASTTANQTFGYWTSYLGLNHTMGRTMTVSLSYLLQYQNSNSSFCVGPTCGSSFVRHEISLSFGWHDRPLAF